MKKHPLKWFINRIGKRIYRKPTLSCSCKHCLHNTSFIITDGSKWKVIPPFMKYGKRYFHARYLFDIQNELDIEYFDKDPNLKEQ